ncbi:MAG: hypothetical protein WD468_11400, partial [Pirellulales bacterium]
VTNLAEAGFLTDELVGRDMDARIIQLEDFSAITDRWATAYFIRVPSEQAPAAAAWIREQLAEDAAADSDGDLGRFRFSTMDESIDPAFWRPVVLVVLAGVASFVLGQHFSDPNGRRLPSGNSLSTAVDRIGQPLVSEPAPGKPRHRLVFDRQREAWYLDSDHDGDGFFDGRQQFHASGAAW